MKRVKWKYNIGDRIISPPDSKEKYDYVITNRETRPEKHKKKNGEDGYDYYQEQYYEYSCNLCGATNLWKRVVHVNNTKCSCCSGRTRVRGINTIGDLHPGIIPYFDDDDAFDPQYTHESRYDVICPDCGHRKNMRIGHLLDQNFVCDYCNSIGIKRPELVKYFVNKEEAYETSYGNSKKVFLRCPDCGRERHVETNNLYRDGFSCDRCGDGISFPEKFMINVLTQLSVNFVFQANRSALDWCGRYRYDFYIPDKSLIIETHGEQHYRDSYGYYCSVDEIQRNDAEKERLARKNSINKYVVVDCRYSNTEWIMNSVLASELNDLYNLSCVDWNACAAFATKNIVKEICEYWRDNCHDATTTDLAKKFHVSSDTIVKYLRRGIELGWCEYEANKEMKKANSRTITACAKPVMVFNANECVGVFNSIAELARKSIEIYGVRFHSSTISAICKGTSKQSHGYTFKYANS